MKRSLRIGLFCSIFLVGGALVACESIIGADFGNVKEIDCAHVAPPNPPSISGPTTGHDITFVMTTFDLGDADDSNGGRYRSIGYDLDQVCTNETQRADCQSPPWANADPTDGIDGRDNAIGQLVHTQSAAFGSTIFTSTEESTLTLKGKIAPIGLFRVVGYSGEADDDSVSVEWYTAALPPPGGNTNIDFTATPVTVPVSLASVTLNAAPTGDGGSPGYLPRFVDTKAYVNHSTLVAHFTTGPAAQIVNVPFPVVTATLTGTLSGNSDHLTNGTLAGVVKMTDMFHLLPRFTNTLTGAPVCQSESYYKQIKSFYCKFVDIRTSGDPDPNAPCDGDSFGVAFDTLPAALGAVVDDSMAELCPGDGIIDDCNNPP